MLTSARMHVQVASFLQDDTTIRTASLRLAHAYRLAFRQDLSSHSELFAVAHRRPADFKSDCFFPNFHDSFPRSPGPHLSDVLASLATLNLPELTSVADHLALHEALLGSVPLRAAALTCHLHDGRLDLIDALDANLASTPLHYAVLALAPALAIGTIPPVESLRVPSWALRRTECLAPLLPHLDHLRHLIIAGADGGLHSNRLRRFLDQLAAAGNPGLESLDFCTCRCSLASPHLALAAHPPKGPHVAHGAKLRGYLCIAAHTTDAADGDVAAALPPPAVPPSLAGLRRVSLAISSVDVGASLAMLPLAELTCLRLCVFQRGGRRHRARAQDGATAVSAMAEAVAAAPRLQTLHLDLSLGQEEARPRLDALVAAIATCTALRRLRLSPRWFEPSPFLWLLPLAALGETLEDLAAPPCFELLQKLPKLSALEFTAAVDDVTPAMMQVLLRLRRLRTLALVNELTFDTYDIERSAHSEALDQLQTSCAVIGSSQDVWSRSVEGFRRRSHECRCWDPCGHRVHAAPPPPAPARPAAVTMVVRGDTHGRAEALAPDGAADGGLALTPRSSDQTSARDGIGAGAGGSGSSRLSAVDTAVAVWPELGFLRGLRHVRLLVREPTNRHRDMLFWEAVALLPHLEHLEVVGLPGEPGVSGFLRALAGQRTLQRVVLHGKEDHAHALLGLGTAVRDLPALRELCVDADMCDMHALRTCDFSPGRGGWELEEHEWELEALRRALSLLCERWKAVLTAVVLQQPQIERLQARVRCTALSRF